MPFNRVNNDIRKCALACYVLLAVDIWSLEEMYSNASVYSELYC